MPGARFPFTHTSSSPSPCRRSRLRESALTKIGRTLPRWLGRLLGATLPAVGSRPLSRLAETLTGRLLFRRVPPRPELVELMREEAAALGDAEVDVIDLWDSLRRELRQRLRAGDPAEFLHWPPVRQAMGMRSHRRVVSGLAHLRARPDWRRRWRSAVRETTLGHPRPFPRCPWSSANLIFQAYNLCRFEEATGQSLATMGTIVEFGGGYGRLCHLVYDLGFRGTYVIFDLPEVAVLQRFYLRHVGLAVSEARDAAWPAGGVVTIVDQADLHALLSARPRGEAAFVAVGSLSEAPLALAGTSSAMLRPSTLSWSSIRPSTIRSTIAPISPNGAPDSTPTTGTTCRSPPSTKMPGTSSATVA